MVGPKRTSIRRLLSPRRPGFQHPSLPHPGRRLFSFPTHHSRLDLPVALPTGEAGRSSARQCHELKLPGGAEGWLRSPEARPLDRPCRARGNRWEMRDSGGRFRFFLSNGFFAIVFLEGFHWFLVCMHYWSLSAMYVLLFPSRCGE
jgi:hypothetical protein